MRLGALLVLMLGLLLPVGCSTEGKRSAAISQPVTPPAPYLRLSKSGTNLVQLQIAVRQFLPVRGSGPAIWLMGVSHLGETNYYAALQQRLNAQSLVLFEGVTDRTMGSAPPAPSARSPRASLQTEMAKSLGLVFQLEALDYDSPKFRNSDLSVQDLRETLAAQTNSPDQAGASQGFESLLQMMQGGTFWDSLLRGAFRFIGSNPRLQAMSKLTLIEMLGQIQGDPSQLGGLPPSLKQLLDLLIVKRNEKVVADLKQEVRHHRSRDSIAVIYGTGHMPDLEVRLRKELGYRPGEEVWLNALEVDLARSGITPAEHQFLRGVIKSQLPTK
jgi:hypothetical protein